MQIRRWNRTNVAQIKQAKVVNLVLGIIYIPPQMAKTKNVLNEIYPMIATALAMTNHICILGDFNQDFKEPPEQAKNMMHQFNLQQLIESPTHFTQGSSSILDHIYVSQSEDVSETFSLPGISDHYVIGTTIDMNVQKEPAKYITYRSMRHFNEDKYINDLIAEPWENVFNEPDPQQKATIFQNYMQSAIDKNCPIVRRKMKSRHAMWFNDDIREAKRQKFEWLKQYNATNHFIAKIMLKHYEKKERALIRQAEKDYYNKKLQNCSNDSRKTWQLLNELVPTKQKAQSYESKKPISNLCDDYNDHFVKVGKLAAETAAKQAQKVDISEFKSIPKINIADNLRFNIDRVQEREVKRIIMATPNHKAAGSDEIKPVFIKKSFEVTLPAITNISNSCIANSIMPKIWKIAKVRPIQKIKGNTEATNQRPIALLPILSKAFERVVYDQFIRYVEKHKRLSEYQNGCRPRNSTETALLKICNDIHASTDKGEVTALISFDCSKAFDSISHEGLLKRLANIGASEKAQKWFESYLSERTQYTSIDTETSMVKDIKYGVPQGSIFGGLLFCIYVDPILNEINMSKEMYVDDLTIYEAFKPDQAIPSSKNIEQECQKIIKWYCANELQLNPSKTKLMYFGQPNKISEVKEKIKIEVDGAKLEPKNSLKLLGMELDEKLDFKAHITEVSKKCSKLLYRINRIRHLLTNTTTEKMIKCTIMSRLQYCASLLTSANKDSISQMQSVQNYAIKILTKNTCVQICHQYTKN